MKKLLASFAIATASLLAAAPAAHAAAYTFGDLSAGGEFFETSEFYKPSPTAPNTTDTFSFSLSSASSLVAEGATLAFNLFSTTFDGVFDAVSLVRDGNFVAANGVIGGDFKSFSLTATNLTAGNYVLSVTGRATGTGAYAGYGVAGTVSPVPEPESYAMMLAGLALMGAIARKRSQNKA